MQRVQKAFTYPLSCLVGAGVLVLAGCSDGDKRPGLLPGSPPTSAPPVSARPTGPAYSGPALPGLAERPAWSITADGSRVTVLDLGSTVAVARMADGKDGAAAYTPHRVEIYDPKTGRTVRTLETQGRPEVQQGVDGPILVVQGFRSTPSDGLRESKTTPVYESYRPDGTRIATGEPPAGASARVRAGQVLMSNKNTKDWHTAPIDNMAGTKPLACSTDKCSPFLKEPEVPGIVFVRDGDDQFALDPVTGAKRWSVAALAPPAGASGLPESLGLADGKLVLAWKLERGGNEEYALTLHDPATGAQTGTGPTGPFRPSVSVEDKSSTMVATLWGDSPDARAGLWDTATGQHTWLQAAEGERPLKPMAVFGGTVYSDESLAADVRTGRVVNRKLPLVVPPAPVGGTHVVLVTENAVHCFPLAKAAPEAPVKAAPAPAPAPATPGLLGLSLDMKHLPGAKVAPKGAEGKPAVTPGSGAERAGLLPGDVVTKADGTTVNNSAHLIELISRRNAGDIVRIEYVRGGNTATAEVTLGARQ